jgi:hypothetical protein
MIAFTLLTDREHLMWMHLIVSNTVTSRETTLCFPPSHSIRRLMTISTFGGTDVNSRASDSLVPNAGLLQRSMAFKHHATQDLLGMAAHTGPLVIFISHLPTKSTTQLSNNLGTTVSSLMQRRVEKTLR